MINKIKQWLRGVLNKMFKTNEIKKQFGIDFAITDKMTSAIELWGKMYENKSPWLDDKTQSLNLAPTIASEIARLVTLEFESEITGSTRAEYLNKVYQKMIERIRKDTEYSCAKGGCYYKPYLNDNNEICVETIQADYVFPTEFNSDGDVIGCIFVTQKTENNKVFTKLEYHRFDNKVYMIDNMAFESNKRDMLGEKISLTSVSEWSNIEPHVEIANLTKPLFSYFRIPLANQIEPSSPLGVSVYSRAVDLIKEADKQYSRILWEYEGSELAIDGDITVLAQNENNKKLGLPHLKDRLFRASGQSQDGSFYNVFSPQIRDTSLFNGLNEILKKIEFNCGLAYGTLSNPQSIEKTATEIKQSKQRSYANVSDIQKSLQHAIDNLIYSIDAMTTLYNLTAQGEYEISYKWDDSIIIDADAERKQDMADVSMGVMSKAEYRAKWYGETIEDAMQKIPTQADLLE